MSESPKPKPKPSLKPKTRFLRFNLKTLLAMMLICGVLMGLVAPKVLRARREAKAIAAIDEILDKSLPMSGQKRQKSN